MTRRRSYQPNVYAPQPSYGAPGPSSSYSPPHNYPPPNGPPPPAAAAYLQAPYHGRDPSSTTLASNESYYKEGRISVDYRAAVNRTPSPTPSEAEALAGKSRSCDLRGMVRKYLNPEWLKQPRNLGAYPRSRSSLLFGSFLSVLPCPSVLPVRPLCVPLALLACASLTSHARTQSRSSSPSSSSAASSRSSRSRTRSSTPSGPPSTGSRRASLPLLLPSLPSSPFPRMPARPRPRRCWH